jgi:hypothetical protein
MKNLSPKSALLVIFAAVFLGSCIAPVGNLQKFFDDDTVDGFIERTVRAKVRVDGPSYLEGGDKIIKGLRADEYYVVLEEKDPDLKLLTNKPFPMFVTDYVSPGGLQKELGYITRIEDGMIIGDTTNNLENFNTYTVRAAAPFPKDTEFTYSYVNSEGITKEDKILIEGDDGVLSIPFWQEQGSLSFTDFEEFFPDDVEAEYIMVPISFKRAGTGYSAETFENLIECQAEKTTVDYVFAEKNIPFPWRFRVLQVVIGPVYVPPEITVDLILAPLPEDHAELPTDYIDDLTIHIGRLDGLSSITLKFNTTGFSEIVWKINGIEIDDLVYVRLVGNETTLTINNSAKFAVDPYNVLVQGSTIDVTVEAEKEGKQWGAKVEIEVRL